MLGRDVSLERGQSGGASPASSFSSIENEVMNQATRCVRKFAPEGRKRMQRTDNGHITACKISDANPNEMIASWSGDHIYSFDLVNSQDASETGALSSGATVSSQEKGRLKQSMDRKRKRTKQSPNGSLKASARNSKSRRASGVDREMALRVRYENGQSEDIAMNNIPRNSPLLQREAARESILDESQKRSLQIAKSSVKVRKLIFSLEASKTSADDSLDPSQHSSSFTSALGFAATCLPEMDEISRSWRYPVNPLPEDVVLQRTLRSNRDSSRRFLHAAGTLSRLLGGRLQTAGGGSTAKKLFHEIGPGPHQEPDKFLSASEMFRYDFLKAITLWLEGGLERLIEGFTRPSNEGKNNPRFPIPMDADVSAIDQILIPYLLQHATDTPIPNVEASRFERDETRQTFKSEADAVIAFSHAIKMPLEDLSRAVMPAGDGQEVQTMPPLQDRSTAVKFWGFKVSRGLLMLASEGVNFQFVDTAFGGLGANEMEEGPSQEDVDVNEEEEVVQSISLVENASQIRDEDDSENLMKGEDDQKKRRQGSISRQSEGTDTDIDDVESTADVVMMDHLHDEIVQRMGVNGQNYREEDREEEDEIDDDEDDDEDITAEERTFMFRSASDRGKLREGVERDVSCFAHTRQYRGHCNVKTVKDANFFGLNDEYVVSGSDSGHLFIWDKKTSEVVNILEGDNEVVNVIQGMGTPTLSKMLQILICVSQGHPYEPLLAVSGIDHTIKIFSPDHRAQHDAANGINISSTTNGSSGYSSLSYRRRRSNPNEESQPRTEQEGLHSRKRIDQQYQITSQNDAQRQGGMRDASITVSRFPWVRMMPMGFADWIAWMDG